MRWRKLYQQLREALRNAAGDEEATKREVWRRLSQRDALLKRRRELLAENRDLRVQVRNLQSANTVKAQLIVNLQKIVKQHRRGSC